MVILIASCALVAVGVAAWLIVNDGRGDSHSCDPFTPAAWRRGVDMTVEPSRKAQAEALVDCGLLDGKPEHEVTRLLGRPPGSRYPSRKGVQLSWGLETDYLGDTSAYLTIYLDRHGRVRKISCDEPYQNRSCRG